MLCSLLASVSAELLLRPYGWTAALHCAAIVMLGMGSLWFLVHPDRGIDPAGA